MEQLNPEIVSRLRSMAGSGSTVAEMLREVIRAFAPHKPHLLTLAHYFRAAFGLTLVQVKPLGGWSPDGRGELSDSQLHEFIMPEIEANRPAWDASELKPSA